MPISNIRDVSSAGKGFSNSALNNRNSGKGEDAFSVEGAPKQEQLQPINEKNAGNNAQTTMGQKDLIPLAITSSKNQTLAVETVKDILDTNLLSTAKLNGYTELVGELEQLSASLYIPAKDLVKEMTEQEKQNTMFSGDKFFDILREIAKDAEPDQKEAIGNMLKAINFSQNRREITTAVSANLRFLAEYFSPNKGLSGRLTDLADLWGKDSAQNNFTALRDQTSELMQSLSDSLLNDSHTQTLLPIVTHNLSKFNTNASMLREYFNQLLTLIPSYETRNELSKSFEALLAKLVRKDPSLMPKGFEETDTDFANSFDQRFALDGEQAETAQNARPEQFSQDTEGAGRNMTADPNTASGIPAGAEQRPEMPSQNIPLDNYTTNEQKNQGENNILGNEYQPDKAISAYLTNVLGDNDYIMQSGLDEMDFTGFVNLLHNGTTTPEETIKAVLGSLIEDNDIRQALDSQLSQITSPAQMVDFLNEFLEAMPDSSLRDKVYEVLEEAVNHMDEPEIPDDRDVKQYVPEDNTRQLDQQQQVQKKSSSIQALTDFVEKNINHPALKSIDSFNASNLLQSMINAPGVMTPLAHYILPVQVENTRAFGELWVDNDDDSGATGSGDGSSHHHLFLTFDVDTYGRFEVDVYANDKTVRVSLLHPTSFTKNVAQITEKINRIAATTRYSIADFTTGVLKEPHNLTQIFPKLSERRAGLNVNA
ncbi:MAG: hypothetical protein IJU82_05825 [Ruminiclostridium sp.]|nr:hypothetical protein [Ruminiclostridium sp.]